jgi:amino acid transporter
MADFNDVEKTAYTPFITLNTSDDVEKTTYKTNSDKHSDETLPAPGYSRDDHETQTGNIERHDGFFSAFMAHSFKRNHNARMVTEATDNEGRPLPDQPPAEPAVAMKLKPRHLQMIAIGGLIGEQFPFKS